MEQVEAYRRKRKDNTNMNQKKMLKTSRGERETVHGQIGAVALISA